MPTRRSHVFLFALAATLVAVAPSPGTAASADGERPSSTLTSERTPAPVHWAKAELAARFAVEAVGTPYRWGGESPSSGFDCSGLVRWAYGRVGIDLPHSSYALYDEGRRVPRAAMEPGDIVFFEGLGHVGLYVGRGRMVHAPQTGRNVEVVPLAGTSYGARLIAARRVAVS